MSTPAPALTQDQLNSLQQDPQIMELGGQLYIAKLFHYIVNLTHAGNDTQNASFQIDSDADFQLLFLMSTQTSTSLSIQITEGSAGGLAWQSDFVNILNFTGTDLNCSQGCVVLIVVRRGRRRLFQISGCVCVPPQSSIDIAEQTEIRALLLAIGGNLEQ